MKKIFYLSLLTALSLAAQEPPAGLPTITVTASAQTPETAAIHDVLRAEPGVVLNTQGGSQNDLSIRGSSFSGAGLSLGGLTLRNPQTEHFHAELPLPATLLSRPDIRTGIRNQGGHLVGTVDFDLLPINGETQIEAGVGSPSRNWQSTQVQHLWTNGIGISLFAGRESADRVDYDDNGLDRAYGGAHLQFHDEDTQMDIVAARQQKDFGARGYYGVSDTLAANEETEDTLLFASALRGDRTADYVRGGLAWRQFHDAYQLPGIGYRNQHRSRVSSAFADGRTLEVNQWALAWRADIDEEHMTSSQLGDFTRTGGGLSLLPQWRGRRLQITAGLRGVFFSGESPYVLPQTALKYQLTDGLSAFAAYTETVRRPSYTELNYNSPASLGRAGLNPQTARQTEIGLTGLPSETMDWTLTAFHRRSAHTIDWIKASPAARWTATDIGTLDVFGAQARAGWYPARNLETQAACTWTRKDQTAEDTGGYASRYALDYPEYLAQLSVLWKPLRMLEIGSVQSVRVQTGNRVRRNGRTGVDGSLVIRFIPPQWKRAKLSLLIDNLWDDDFQPFPGQRPPGRTVSLVFSTDF